MSYLCSHPGAKCVLLLTGARRLSQDPLAAVQEPALPTAEPGRVSMRCLWSACGSGKQTIVVRLILHLLNPRI